MYEWYLFLGYFAKGDSLYNVNFIMRYIFVYSEITGDGMGKHTEMESSKVAAVFAASPKEINEKLMFLRQLIFSVAAETPGVGELEETLKWGNRVI